MAQALHLMNAPEVEAKISDPAGRVAVLVADGKSQAEIVESLCLTVLGRVANEKDKRIAARLFKPVTASIRALSCKRSIICLVRSATRTRASSSTALKGFDM